MTLASASNLDREKFAKVRALMDGGSTDGERKAARAAATRMAQQAGLTLKQAVSKVDSKPKPQPASPFRGFDDWMEDREPGWKAQEREKRLKREQAKADRRAALLRQHGSAEALFDMTPIEAAIFSAVTPFAKRSLHPDWAGSRKVWFTNEIDGAGAFELLRQASAEAIAAVRRAWPIPTDLAGLLVESRMWEKLRHDRQAFVESEYNPNLEAYARSEVIEHELDTRPVASWDDAQARFDWERFKFERQWIDPTEEKPDGIIPRLREDFAILRKLYEAAVQNGQEAHSPNPGTGSRRTNADKRSDVLSMLDAEPGLSDREISRRVGVSPQTVNTWRKKVRS